MNSKIIEGVGPECLVFVVPDIDPNAFSPRHRFKDDKCAITLKPLFFFPLEKILDVFSRE